MNRPLVLAHRGFARDVPENTVAAFLAAAAAGADGVELDLQQSADGRLVVHHDDDVDGVAIASLARAELPQLPTLEEVLAALPPELLVDAELKQADPGLAAPLLRGRRHVVTSFDPDRVRAASGRRGLLVSGEVELATLLEAAQYARADFLALELGLAGDETLAAVAAALAPSYVWTANEEDDLARLLHSPHVAAVITDRPDAARALAAAGS